MQANERTVVVQKNWINAPCWRVCGGVGSSAASGVIVEANIVSELARKLAQAVPGAGGDLDAVRSDLERNFRGLLNAAFERMDLVTREEFDIQRRVLERTRQKLAELESRLDTVAAAAEPQPASDDAND